MNPIIASSRAPAKVNLCLKVLGRRSDGYHLIESLMTPISLFDELSVKVFPPQRGSNGLQIEVRSEGITVPNGPENIAYRAVEVLLARLGMLHAIEVHIRKRIPVGSGLGGGSSDAAAVLLLLNHLFGSPLQTNDLATLAARIGTDVPFFVYGRPARVGGIGERIVPVPLPKTLWLVVCTDGYALSTRLVYGRLAPSLTRAQAASNITNFIGGRQLISDLLVNDLEAAAAALHPEVLRLKERVLSEGAQGVLMTGSGSAVFGVWPNPEAAHRAAAALRQRGLWAEAVQTLGVSPAVRG
jgi:4-diphosphocytidyl-2-C-methyl-D-erythritol kinase